MSIPPRPWRVAACEPNSAGGRDAYILDANTHGITSTMSRGAAELIVLLVNAEPEIVSALEAAERALAAGGNYNLGDWERDRALVRAALATVRP